VAAPQGFVALNSRTLLNATMALAVLLVGAAVWLGRPKPPANTAAHAITTLKAADVRSIEVVRRGTPAIVLRRSEQLWTMEQPLAARVSSVPVARLMELLQMSAPTRFPAEDLGRYELDRPWARVSFNGLAVDFGATNTMTREVYVASGGYVYAIPARASSAVPPTPSSLLDRQLLPAVQEPVAYELPGFRVEHDGRRWTLTPAVADLSQDDLKRWTDQWRFAASVATRPASTATATPAIRLRLRDGRVVELAILEREPALVLRRMDEGLDYEMPTALGPSLLAPPGSAPGEKS
jgi:hypothetical protein